MVSFVHVLLEDGGGLLLEDGTHLLLEPLSAIGHPDDIFGAGSHLLLEDGGGVLREEDGYILLEPVFVEITEDTHDGGEELRRYRDPKWREQRRKRPVRDDIEAILNPRRDDPELAPQLEPLLARLPDPAQERARQMFHAITQALAADRKAGVLVNESDDEEALIMILANLL